MAPTNDGSYVVNSYSASQGEAAAARCHFLAMGGFRPSIEVSRDNNGTEINICVPALDRDAVDDFIKMWEGDPEDDLVKCSDCGRWFEAGILPGLNPVCHYCQEQRATAEGVRNVG